MHGIKSTVRFVNFMKFIIIWHKIRNISRRTISAVGLQPKEILLKNSVGKANFCLAMHPNQIVKLVVWVIMFLNMKSLQFLVSVAYKQNKKSNFAKLDSNAQERESVWKTRNSREDRRKNSIDICAFIFPYLCLYTCMVGSFSLDFPFSSHANHDSNIDRKKFVHFLHLFLFSTDIKW